MKNKKVVSKKVTHVKKKSSRKSTFGKFVILSGFLTFLFVIATLYSQATLAKVNYDVEKLKVEINNQEKTNQSLSMKISELASLDKIQEVAESEGLSYNNNNIKSVNTSG